MMSIIYSLLLLLVTKYSLEKKPHRKREQAIWKVECELGVITDPDCPVDGGWSPWGSWSSCHGLCDDIGHKQRSRECINPPPSKDGCACSGPSIQTDTCYINNCSIEDFRQLLAGDYLRIEALRQLEAVPALLERCLQMECPFEAIQSALTAENTWQLDAESVWNSLQCVKHNMGCPLVGGWSTWGSWSVCSARCGRGVRWRLRRCDTPPPSAAYLMCEGEPLQSEGCEGDQCAVDEHETRNDVGGTWSLWGGWSACSEVCGVGVSRRKRVCLEKHTPHGSDTWGTHCRGQHDQLETCVNKQCAMSGGWVGWGAWGPCSQTCGAGKRSRVRSCTRPLASGGGTPCHGSRTEVGACYLTPCEAYTHLVTVFNGEGYLQYNIENKMFRLLHVYVRFKPNSQYGTLLRRGTVHGPYTRISLQRWHVCVDASGETPSCSLPRLCSMQTLEPATWHSVMVSITTENVYLQVDNFQPAIKGSFPYTCHLSEEHLLFRIGERLYGEIQEVAVNFVPLNLKILKENHATRTSVTPFAASNVAYEKATIEEAFLYFDDQYLRVPCFNDQDEWFIEFKVKSRRESGLLLFLVDDHVHNWLAILLQNLRVKLKVATDTIRSESSSSTEYLPGEWLDVLLVKKRENNAIEAKLNGEERLHVMLMEENERKRRNDENSYKEENVSNVASVKQNLVPFLICNDELYFGGIPSEVKKTITEDITAFSGILASLNIDGVLKDISEFSMERVNDGTMQLSSRTASISGSYHEIAWGKSRQLNLTCLHARTLRTPQTAQWLFLDTRIAETGMRKKIRAVDDGRVLRLMASAENDLKGFYTCRAHGNRRTRNIVTYGVIGKALQNFQGPDNITCIAVCSTLILLFLTLGWLILEGINDLRNGYGFFRDQHLSPEEEADAICSFIDKNSHLIGSKSAVKIAKMRARRIGKKLSRAAYNDNNRRIVKKITLDKPSDDSTPQSEPESLPALPENPNKPTHEIYRCEVSFVSSPRHGSRMDSPDTKLSSSSTFDLTPPRVLCSRLITSKYRYSPKQMPWRRNSRCSDVPLNQQNKFNFTMPTIKSSGVINLSPGQKILKKFQQLKIYDS